MRWQDTGRGGTLYYPIWLSYAAGLLENNGHKVRLVDAPAWDWDIEKVIEDLKKFSPNMVVVGTSFTSVNNDLDVSKKTKSEFDVDVPVVMVGPPASQFPEKMLDGGVDIVARYEYDFTMAELAERTEEGESIDGVPGISFKQNGAVIHNPNRPWTMSGELDELPFVSKVYKSHLNVHNYFLNYSLYPMVQIFTGRGCPYQCTFCSWPQSFMGRKYRVRSVENILDELEWIEENLPTKEVFFEDDTFTISKKRVLEFCKRYKERDLDISWSCNARADTLDLETMKEMKKANCRFLIVGFESANDEILKNIKKGFTVEQARGFAKNVKKARLLLHADFIIGLPGETKETIEKTKMFIKEIKPEQLQVSVSSPFPGTELYEWCRENGYLLTDDPNEYLDEQGHQKAIISYPELTNKEMVKEVDKILKDYYLSISYVPLALRQVLRRHGLDEMRRLWYSTRM
ncbi:MAG: radical SAM protein, partial [Methanophagales archaeon]|nr:radical SAM protein [Methanophagales archaeon]